MPFLHILLYLITNHRCEDTELLDKLGDEINELRMLPLPIGLLANELIEVIDQERIMPGITWVGKFAEDFPFLDHHSTKKEKSEDKFTTNH